MRRTVRPIVDLLESKALLTAFAGPIHAPAAPVAPSGVTASVIVSSPTIAPQGSVTFSLVETNHTANTVSIVVPASKEGFAVYERGIEVWKSPAPLSQASLDVTLAPGQSKTIFAATWNDTGNVHPVTAVGTFTVVNEFDPTASTGTVTVTTPGGSTGTGTPTSPTFPRNPPKLYTTFG